MRIRHRWLLAGLLAGLAACASSPAASVDDPVATAKLRWQAVLADESAMAEGASLRELALELASFAGSPDPVLRDEIGYEVSARWIGAGRLSSADLRELLRLHLTNLHAGLGETESDGVFLRSFSALHLSLLIARDRTQPFLEDADVRELVGSIARLLREERDRRGWVEGKGWAHPIAHAADAAKFLARHRFLDSPDAALLFSGIEAGLEGPNAWGENDRLAAAAQSLFVRAEFDSASLDARCLVWIQDAAAVWQASPFDPGLFRRSENRKQFLRALFARLNTVSAPDERTQQVAQRALETLAQMR